MKRRGAWIAAAVGACALAALGSCGSDDGVSPDGENDLLSLLEPILEAELAGAAHNVQLPDGPPGCLTMAPWPWQDGDGDGVPDSATFSFDPGACAWTDGIAGGTRGGIVEVTDPGDPFGYQAVLIDHVFSNTYTRDGVRTTATRAINGTQGVSGSSSAAVMARDVTIVTTLTGRPTSTTVGSLTLAYAAQAGQPILFGPGAPLPPGSLTLGGTLAWSIPGRTVELEITTPEALVLSAACPGTDPVSGEIHVTVVSGADPGYLSIRFVGCDQAPEIEWFPQG